jgi:lysozyme
MARTRRRLILACAVGSLAIAATAAALVWEGRLRFAYPDRTRFPVRGIDVSHHQGAVNWGEVAKAGIRFAYVKASEGGDFRDQDFDRNAAGARNAGLAVGAYHFFTLCRPGREQAANFLAATRNASLQMPPAIDLEYMGNCSNRMTRPQFERELSDFMGQLQADGRPAPVLYVTRAFHDAYLAGGEFAARPLWFRDLFFVLSPPTGGTVSIWQFANRARVSGIAGPVDLNVLVPPARLP